MSEAIGIILIVVTVIITLVFSGFFETWIVKECTWCGAKGKLTAISHHGAIELGQGFRGPLQRESFGVIHKNIVCQLCFDRWSWDSCFARLPDGVREMIAARHPRP